jgi:hypothetical protein
MGGVRRWAAASATLGVALVLGGCGDDGDAGTESAAGAGDPADPAQGDEETATDGDATAGAPRTDMTAADGFNGPLDHEHDHAPGTGTVTFGGEEIELSVECLDHGQDQDRLFWLDAHGEGEDAEGHRTTAQAQRQIMVEPDQFYDYGGQEEGMLLVGRYVDELFHSSAVASPADNDRSGANLPIVRVLEDGSFSASAEMSATSNVAHAPDGETVFTGRCQDDWPGPVTSGS